MVERLCDVYCQLQDAIPALPFLRNFTITGGKESPYEVQERSQAGWDIGQQTKTVLSEGLSLFLPLRAFSTVKATPTCINIELRNFIPRTAELAEDAWHVYHNVLVSSGPPRYCLDNASSVFANLGEFSICSPGPGAESESAVAGAFVDQLGAFIRTVGPRLEVLRVALYDMLSQNCFQIPDLFSTMLKYNHQHRPKLRSLELKGVGIIGSMLTALVASGLLSEGYILKMYI